MAFGMLAGVGRGERRSIRFQARPEDEKEEGAYVAELDEAEFSQGVDNFSANFIGNVELHHAHVRRAERGVFDWSHRGWDGRGLQGVCKRDEERRRGKGKERTESWIARYYSWLVCSPV